MLEGNHKQMPDWLKSFLFEWCHLLTMLTGRGIIYMLIGGIITAAQVCGRLAGPHVRLRSHTLVLTHRLCPPWTPFTPHTTQPWTNLIVGTYVVFIGFVSVYFGWKVNETARGRSPMRMT